MFVAQTGRSLGGGEFTWDSTGGFRPQATALEAARTLGERMQREGLRFSELHAHYADLAAGDVLTADNWVAFRVVPVEG